MKTRKREPLERYIRKAIAEMWTEFQQSPEDRQIVLNGLDRAVLQFADDKTVADFFRNLKQDFLQSEKRGEQ